MVKSILRQAGLTNQEFFRLLGRKITQSHTTPCMPWGGHPFLISAKVRV